MKNLKNQKKFDNILNQKKIESKFFSQLRSNHLKQ